MTTHVSAAPLVLVGAWALTGALSWWLRTGDTLARDGVAALVFYAITETGSAWVVPMLLLVTLVLWGADRGRAARLRRRETLWMFVIMLVCMPATAALVESVVKPRLRMPRPSHERLAEAGWIANLEDFYAQDKRTRRSRLRAHASGEGVEAHAARLELHPRVLEHWIHESGSTFPSAHALNAFLAATLLGGGALAAPTRVRRALAFTFLAWAVAVSVSRVALGVHRPLDVVAGAVGGTLLGALCLGLWWRATQRENAPTRARA